MPNMEIIQHERVSTIIGILLGLINDKCCNLLATEQKYIYISHKSITTQTRSSKIFKKKKCQLIGCTVNI